MTPDQIDTWLTTILTGYGGTADMSVVKAEAEAENIPWRRAERSRARLKIITERSGFGDIRTVWKLPTDVAATAAGTGGVDGVDGIDGGDVLVTDSDENGDLLVKLHRLLSLLTTTGTDLTLSQARWAQASTRVIESRLCEQVQVRAEEIAAESAPMLAGAMGDILAVFGIDRNDPRLGEAVEMVIEKLSRGDYG